MGWTGHKLEKGYMLYTRGGLHGVFIGKESGDFEINIPEELLIGLAAEEVRSTKIEQLEDMNDRDVLGLGNLLD